MSLLNELVKSRQEEVHEEKKKLPLELLISKINTLSPARPFKPAITGEGIHLIAEIKYASPLKGTFPTTAPPQLISRIYEENGASAISVLVPRKYFKGDPSYISEVKESCNLPVLQKDFVTDEYQLYKARYDGADAILLIAKLLRNLGRFIEIVHKIGMHPLVEIHTREELEYALSSGAEIIGINNRDLDTLEVDINRTFELIKYVPEDVIVVSESGIKGRSDIEKLHSIGVNAILVGEALMNSPNIEVKLRELVG